MTTSSRGPRKAVALRVRSSGKSNFVRSSPTALISRVEHYTVRRAGHLDMRRYVFYVTTRRRPAVADCSNFFFSNSPFNRTRDFHFYFREFLKEKTVA